VRALLLLRNTGFEFGLSAATQTAEFHFPNFVSALLSAALAMNPPNFFAELKRRNVIRVAGLYLVGAWLLTQVASTVLPTFDVPSWALRGLIITLALGFVPALIFSWVFELTPQGLKRDAEVPPEQSIAPQTARRMDRMIIAVLALALAYFGFDKFVLAPRRDAARSPIRPNDSNTAVVPEKSIAVLPFENLSDEKANAYFADGIQDEILTKLASVADLKVISRTSTAKYKSKPEDLKTVAQQLGVANVVEGTVQRAADKVRVNVQLIDARADTHLWAKTYDREIKDVFSVESEVSQEIADALQAKLSPHEADALATAPTRDPEAYDLFLKGEYEEREAESSLKAESYDRAAAFYQQALDRDPNFALAAARLAESRLNRHWFVARLDENQLTQVKRVAERALAIAPSLPEAHTALGNFYYLGYRRYDQALAEFQRALELQPNNAKALEFCGYVHRRQAQWELSLSELAKCQDRDPRDASLPANIGALYQTLRMWEEAKRAGYRALAIDPHNVIGMRTVVLSCINGTGNINEAKRALATLPPDIKLINRVVIGNATDILGEGTYLHVIERDFAAALKDWENEAGDLDQNRRRLAARTAIHVLAGDTASAQGEIEKAHALLEVRLRERPDDGSAMTQLAWVDLGLKRNAEAIRLAHRAAELLPIEKDAISGPLFLTGLAQIQARGGEPSEAVKTLRRLLSIPAGLTISIARLKIDPVWDPIRNDPGFQQLLAGTERIGP
jgi:TolB-like protein/Flp pilus assembly protein TadD